MVIGIGCDIEDISRFSNCSDEQEFLDILFTPQEQSYCLKSKNFAAHFAVKFCGKEAIIKALGTLNIEAPKFTEIEIMNNVNNVPEVEILKELGRNLEVNVSLAHSRSMAMAQAVIIIS